MTSVSAQMRGEGKRERERQRAQAKASRGAKMQRDYDFFVQLFRLSIAETSQVDNNPATLQARMMEHREEFKQYNDNQKAKELISDFFMPDNFLRRLLIHQHEICKFKSKQ